MLFSSLRVLFILTVSCLSLALNAQVIEEGVHFNSYDFSQEKRTGIDLTFSEDFTFSKKLNLKFKVSFWKSKATFGYVFRAVNEDGVNIDLISNRNSKNIKDDLFLVIGDSTTDVSFSWEEAGIEQDKWVDVALVIDNASNKISLTVGKQIKVTDFKIDNTVFKIQFGKNFINGVNTSDVPPIEVKNISVVLDNKDKFYWAIKKSSGNTLLDTYHKREAHVYEPNWIIDRHKQWKLLKTVTHDNIPQIVYDNKRKIKLLSKESITTFDLFKKTSQTQEIATPTNLPLAQQSIIHEASNQIWTFDFDKAKINKFDLNTNEWVEVSSDFEKQPTRWHINKINMGDSLYAFFGGYGYHKYHNEMITYDAINHVWRKEKLENLFPRYMSAMGVADDGELIVLGGIGNKQGIQELGKKYIPEISLVNPVDFENKQVYKNMDEVGKFGFSNQLIQNGDSSFVYLKYNIQKYQTKLVLAQSEFRSGAYISLNDSIDFKFHDITSYTDLFYHARTQKYIAVLLEQVDGKYRTRIYSISAPVVFLADEPSQNTASSGTLMYILFGIGGLLLVLVVARYFYVKKRKALEAQAQAEQAAKLREEQLSQAQANPIHIKEEHKKVEVKAVQPKVKIENPEPGKASILILGGFQAIDNEGVDITKKFSSTIRVLFSLIAVHSIRYKKGVSNETIWQTIWSDKTESQARNNRNVNINKLRKILAEIGNITITPQGDTWFVDFGEDVFFDYKYLLEEVHSREMHTEVIYLAKKGNILPKIQDEWVDNYKGELSNMLVDKLIKLGQHFNEYPHILIAIADGIFNHDSINSVALEIKCKSLKNTGKLSLAKKCYDNYAKEYKALYEEDYEYSFEEVISK